jgi:hypothetical protein
MLVAGAVAGLFFAHFPGQAAETDSAEALPAENRGFVDVTTSCGVGDAIARHYE